MKNIEIGGIFLMDMGYQLILFIDQHNADKKILKSIFGTTDLRTLGNNLSENDLFSNKNDSINEKLYHLIDQLRL